APSGEIEPKPSWPRPESTVRLPCPDGHFVAPASICLSRRRVPGNARTKPADRAFLSCTRDLFECIFFEPQAPSFLLLWFALLLLSDVLYPLWPSHLKISEWFRQNLPGVNLLCRRTRQAG